MIVDDEPDAAESLRQLLRIYGHEVRTAATGTEALEHAHGFRPDIDLLDIGLPGMDGYELARQLRECSPGSVLVAVTGHQRNAERLASAGFDHYLVKPIDLDRLKQLLSTPR
jgi:CheY-like chemotaxis protein